jgi:hypothetical protein
MKKEEIGKEKDARNRGKKKEEIGKKKQERRKNIAVCMTSMHRKSYIITTVLWLGAKAQANRTKQQNNIRTEKKRNYK